MELTAKEAFERNGFKLKGKSIGEKIHPQHDLRVDTETWEHEVRGYKIEFWNEFERVVFDSYSYHGKTLYAICMRMKELGWKIDE